MAIPQELKNVLEENRGALVDAGFLLRHQTKSVLKEVCRSLTSILRHWDEAEAIQGKLVSSGVAILEDKVPESMEEEVIAKLATNIGKGHFAVLVMQQERLNLINTASALGAILADQDLADGIDQNVTCLAALNAMLNPPESGLDVE